MAGVADSAVGAILEIPEPALTKIKDAEEAIKQLGATSTRVARSVSKDWGETALTGLDAFIKKVKEANLRIGGLKMPTIDSTGFASSISEIATAMASVDKSATTGSKRIERIADAVSKLSATTPSYAAFKDIADGITLIGSTSDATIAKVSTLAATMATLARDIRTVTAARSADAEKTATAAQYNKLYKEQQQILREILAINRKGSDATVDELNKLSAMKNRYSEIEAQLDRLNKKKKSAASELARVTGATNVGRTADISSAKGAIDYAKQAKSLKELQDAFKNLKAVMATVDPKSEAWRQMNAVLKQTKKNIDVIRNKMGEFKTQSTNVAGIVGQLRNQLAAAFSVAAIGGFIKKMVEVRAQFELQNVSLRAILQNKNEADRIFAQVQQMALQSPFTIMQLTTYTKQLAAYRIESEKLVGTTKMLADVSAGLGVDMGRLILAFGQVKSANYLRACLGLGTPVMLHNGTFKNVEDIVVGDVLMGDDETPRHVSKLYQGKQQMYRVIYNGGEFRCNEHHILTVYDALNERIDDVFVFDYLKEPHRYQGVKRVDGKFEVFPMKVVADKVDTYYGFSIDGNHRFIIQDNIVTHNTEIRQFTEAGLNIAGELANYFSELQGKMVSVGDVMEMVSKRMVRFEDVEEVFKRVTSAGGLFYDMQKKQSESLFGQLQRIQDAYSIMLNEIGQSNQGVISYALSAIRSLINSWRTLLPIISAAGAGMAMFFATKAIVYMINQLRVARVAVLRLVHAINMGTIAWKTFNAATKATAIGAILSVIVSIVAAIATAASNTDKFTEALTRLYNEHVTEKQKMIDDFQDLADTIRDNTKSADERQSALEDLKRVYSGVLPQYMLEIEYLKSVTDGYKDAKNAIALYSAEKSKALANEKVNEALEDEWSKWTDNVVEDTIDALTRGINDEVLDTYSESTIKGYTRRILMDLRQELESGLIEESEAFDEFLNRLQEKTGAKFSAWRRGVFIQEMGGLIGNSINRHAAFNDLGDVLEKRKDFLEEYVAAYEDTLTATQKAEMKSYENFKILYKYRSDDLNKFRNSLNALASMRQKIDKGDTDAQNNAIIYAQKLEEVKALFNKINEEHQQMRGGALSWQEIENSISSTTQTMVTFDGINEKVMSNLLSRLKTVNAYAQSPAFQGWVETMVNANNQTKQISQGGMYAIEVGTKLAEKMGLSVNLVDKLQLSVKSTVGSAATDAKNEAKMLDDGLKRYETAVKAWIKQGFVFDEVAKRRMQSEYLGGKTKEEAEKEKKYYLDYSELLGNGDEKSTTKKGTDMWQKRIGLIKELNTEYEKLLKYYSEGEAKLRIQQSYAEAVAEAFKGIKYKGADLGEIEAWQGFDKQGMIDQLRAILDSGLKITPEKRIEIKKMIGGFEAELEIKIREEEIQKAKDKVQKAFDNYELTKELGKLGMNVDLTYMVGGKPTSLEDVRKQIEESLSDIKVKGGQEELVKYYEEQLRKVADLENKAQKERLKSYEKYLKRAYSDSAKVQLEYYTKLTQMQEDIAKAEKNLKEQLAKPETSAEDRLKIQKALENLPNQASRAAKGMREEMEKELDKLNLDKLLKSPLFSEMFQDLGSMTNKVLDTMLVKIRDIQKGANDLSLSEVRRLAQYAEKIEKAKIDNSPFMEAYNAIKKAYELRAKGITAKSASDALAVSEEELERLETLKKDISLILGIKEKSYQIDGQSVIAGGEQIELTEQQLSLLGKSTTELNEQSNALDKGIKKQKQVVTANAQNVQVFKNAKTATEKFGAALQEIAKVGIEAINAIKAGLQVFGKEIGEEDEVWLDFVGNMLSTCITLGIAFVALGIQINTALGIIGLIATALSVVAQLFTAIFQAHDKRLEKQIERVQDRVDALSKSFEKLQKSIEKAFSISDENALTEQALSNLEQQKRGYQEMIRLEQSKKKSDSKKIKEYKEKLEELAEAEKELYDKKHEKYGSTNDVWDEANNWLDTWLNAYKESGDGLDALNEKWDDFYENLVKKQATSKVLGDRMNKYVEMINEAIDRNMDEYGYVDAFKTIGEKFKTEFGDMNKKLIEFFKYAGIGTGKSELLLSDLQKGIQNITEPQAAAIEAYLNSMRFAVFRHTEQLDALLATIQMQYGSDTENPVVTELKGIRGVLDNIDKRLASVINTRGGNATLRIGT